MQKFSQQHNHHLFPLIYYQGSALLYQGQVLYLPRGTIDVQINFQMELRSPCIREFLCQVQRINVQ